MRRSWIALCALLCLFPLAPLCWAGNGLTVQSPWVRATLPGQKISSGYFRLVNTGAQPVVVVGVSSDRAPTVEMHTHAHENGMMRMRQVNQVTVPAGDNLAFEPGSFHLMLLDLPAPLKPGETITLKLKCADGTTVTVVSPVKTISEGMGTKSPVH
jgi:periplasmic copper chaperone A